VVELVKKLLSLQINYFIMETTRQSKIARLIQKEISEIFLGFTRSLQQGILVSPTIVRISPDLSVARVYISVFPTNKEQEILDLMNEKSVSIRHDLAQRTRHQLRTVPTLTFFLDDSLDYLENIDQLLKG
jgi:ribosome-binding factor A